MLRFAHIEYLWGLAALPVFILVFIAVSQWKKKALATLGDKKVISLMMPMVSLSRPWLKFILFIVALFFIIIGLADPQIGSKMEEEKRGTFLEEGLGRRDGAGQSKISAEILCA